MNYNSSLLRWTAFITLTLIATCSPAAEPKLSPGFVSMFNGKTLQGWSVMPAKAKLAWTAENGMIVGDGDKGRSYLVFDNHEIADFEMKLSYRFPGKGNSGINLRAIPDKTGKRLFQGYHVDFGHAEALDELNAEALLHVRPPFLGDGDGHDLLQAVLPIAVASWGAVNEFGHHPESVGEGDPLVDHDVEPVGDAETLRHVRGRSGQVGGPDLHEQAVRMKQGHAAEVAVAGGDLHRAHRGQAEEVAVPLRHEDALRGACGARGVHDRADVARFRIEYGIGPSLGGEQGLHVEASGGVEGGGDRGSGLAVVDEKRCLDVDDRSVHRLEAIEEAVVDGHDARLAVVDLVLEKRSAQLGVDRDEDRPALVHRHHQQHELATVGQQTQQSIAGLEPEVREGGGESVGEFVELPVGQRGTVLEGQEVGVSSRSSLSANSVDQRPPASRQLRTQGVEIGVAPHMQGDRRLAAMNVGDLVDDFTARDQHGDEVTLSSLLEAGPGVLFFYPKAMTPG